MAAAADDFDDDYDDYYDDDDGISGFVILVVGVVVLAVFMAIVWFAYKRGIQDAVVTNDGAVPTIVAAPGPVKSERDLPETTTGNPEVFDRLEGNTPTEIIVEAAGERDPLEGFTETVSAADTTARDTIAEMAATTNETIAEITPKPIPPKPEPKPEPVLAQPAVTVTAASAATGTHVVQVGAFRSDAEANRFFNKLSAKFGTLLADKRPDVERADLGAKGVYHRLRVGPFYLKRDSAILL